MQVIPETVQRFQDWIKANWPNGIEDCDMREMDELWLDAFQVPYTDAEMRSWPEYQDAVDKEFWMGVMN